MTDWMERRDAIEILVRIEHDSEVDARSRNIVVTISEEEYSLRGRRS
jgi:hypothetical protein